VLNHLSPNKQMRHICETLLDLKRQTWSLENSTSEISEKDASLLSDACLQDIHHTYQGKTFTCSLKKKSLHTEGKITGGGMIFLGQLHR